MAGNDDFRAARARAALACEAYNRLSECATPEERVLHWLNIVDPDNKTTTTNTAIVSFSDLPQWRASGLDRAPPRPTASYTKIPFHVDYGLRLRIAPTTFINRNCFILDTPVADIVIGEHCTIGPNVTIVGVGHPVVYEDRCELLTGRAGSWGAKVDVGDGVWIGAGVTILLVNKDVPARTMAAGKPATVRYRIQNHNATTDIVNTALTLEQALKMSHDAPSTDP